MYNPCLYGQTTSFDGAMANLDHNEKQREEEDAATEIRK